MTGNVVIHPWCIERYSEIDDLSESVFFTGNGYIGLRGFAGWQCKKSPRDHAVFRAGLFSAIRPGITDMVQLPDVTTVIPEGHTPVQVLQRLDLKRAVAEWEWDTDDFRFLMQRIASMADPQLICVRLKVSALKNANLNVKVVEDPRVSNLPVHDDQTIQSTDLVTLLVPDEITERHMTFHTIAEKEPVHISWRVTDSLSARSRVTVGDTVSETLSARLAAGDEWVIEKRIRVLCGNETANPDTDDPWAEHEKAWSLLLNDCDIVIDADDPDLQGALRWNIYQMLASNAASRSDVSIGARGLTHGRYKGNTFWDTEIFLFPFYMWTRPAAARNLLMYRVSRLDDAKALARRQNLEGARYPWMCSSDGSEQCESWDIGLCEVHITADIAYAADRYATVTGDAAFGSEIAELMLETARYWKSRLTWEPGKAQYSSFFVKGPDEYCGAAVNNTYTNYMARHNIDLALKYAAMPDEERKELTFVRDHIAILYDPERRLYLQDETLDRLPPLERPRSDAPVYHEICFDRLQRYRVLKQADLVLLMTLFPSGFTAEEKRNVFEAYEPITLHDSTLSWGIHAELALQTGLWEKGETYLKKALLLDLKDLMGNTGREGVHMAALGAAWQAVVCGAAGLWDNGGVPEVRPMLPPSVHGLSFTVRCHGERWRISITENGSSVTRE